MAASRIIIVGGGFGGVQCAKHLRKQLNADQHEIIVFNRENHMVFHPLLAELAASVVEPSQVAAPLRLLLKGVQCRSEEVIGIELAEKMIEYQAYDGNRHTMSFDQLIIANGCTVNLADIPGMADHAFPLKTLGDAIAIQAQVIGQLEKADVCENAERKKSYLSFAVIGGGFSGVEMAGELNDFVKNSSKFYPNVLPGEVQVTLVHSGSQILPEVSPSLRDFAAEKMKEQGIKIELNVGAATCTGEGVGLSDGRFIKAATVICTIGTRPLPMIQRLAVPKDRGRIITRPDMSIPDHPDVWVIGDCAAIVNAYDGKYSPPTGQFAERQGKQAAANVVARLKGLPTRPFSHQSLGALCSIGGRNAVAETFGLKISGFPAWFVWRGVYLFKLPSFAQQVRVGIDWMLDLIFPRQLAHLKTDPTKKIGKAHYSKGDYIFQVGEAATDFYVVEEGEVEVLRPAGAGEMRRIAVLGPGDFFGERAMIDNRPRSHACRAATTAELLVIGRSVFEEISTSLPPLRSAIAHAIQRRTPIWDELKAIYQILEEMPVAQFTERPLGDALHPDTLLLEAIREINKHRLEFCYVIEPDSKLLGILTRTDLLRSLEVAASVPLEHRLKIMVKEILLPDPIVVEESDSAAMAIAIMRDHNLKNLPVVSNNDERVLRGYVRFENILEAAVDKAVAAVSMV